MVTVFLCLFLLCCHKGKKKHRGKTQAQALYACCLNWLQTWVSSWFSQGQPLFRQNLLWAPYVKSRWGFSFCLVLCPESCALWPVIIFSLVSTIWKMHLLGYNLVANQMDWNSETQSHNQYSLYPAVPALRGVCHKGSQSVRGLWHLNLHCFASAGKVPFQHWLPGVSD